MIKACLASLALGLLLGALVCYRLARPRALAVASLSTTTRATAEVARLVVKEEGPVKITTTITRAPLRNIHNAGRSRGKDARSTSFCVGETIVRVEERGTVSTRQASVADTRADSSSRQTLAPVPAAKPPAWAFEWSPGLLPARDLLGTFQLQRRLFGPFWIGAWVRPSSSSPALGGTLRVEW